MPQGARVPQDVVEHVAVRVNDALRGAGGSGREVDVRDGVRWDVDRGRRMSRPPQEVVDEERRSLRPGHRRGDGRGPPVGEDEASAHGVRHLAQPRRRVRRVERDVGLAGPQGPEGRRDVREPLVQDEHDRLPPGAQALDERAGDPARQLVEPAVGHAVGAVGHGEAVPMRRNHPPEPGRQRLLHPLRPEDRGPVLATPVLIAGHRPAPRPRARWRETPLTRGPRARGRGAIRTADLLGAIRALSRPGGARRRGEPTARPGPGGPALVTDGRSSRGRRARLTRREDARMGRVPRADARIRIADPSLRRTSRVMPQRREASRDDHGGDSGARRAEA